MSIALKISAVLVLAPTAFLMGALLMNRVPVSDAPGLIARVKLSLTGNRAETDAESPFPELRPRVFRIEPAVLFRTALSAAQDLGWRLQEKDESTLRARFVVISALWRFRDDLELAARRTAEGDGAWLYLKSQSRIGRGDLGANARHIADLLRAVETDLASRPS